MKQKQAQNIMATPLESETNSDSLGQASESLIWLAAPIFSQQLDPQVCCEFTDHLLHHKAALLTGKVS